VTWSAARPSGVAQAGSLAVGRFLQTNRQAIAVTSLALNRIHVLDLASPNNAPAPHAFNTPHPALTMLVGLESPYGTNGLPPQHLDWTSAGTHDPGITLLDLLLYTIGDAQSAFQDQLVAEGYLSSGNALPLGSNETTVVAGMRRGSNDTFAAYSYAAQSNVLHRVGLHSGTEFTFGQFRWSQDLQPVPALIFYVPGRSNIMVQRITETVNGFALSAPVTSTFTSAIQRVYYVSEGTNGYGVIHFGDGAVGVRPGGSGELNVSQGLGLGAAGKVITGFVPLGVGKFALFSGASNTFASAQAQVFTQSGSDYVVTSTSTLPKTTSSATRANVWLFASEPFVNARPGFVASLNAGDWVASVSGLPGTISVVVETDRDLTNGLGNPVAQNLGSAPNSAPYGIANQFHPAISLFSYSGPRAPQRIQVTIAPPAGHFPDPINVSFTSIDPTDHVYYRVGSAGAFAEYGAPFPLATNAQVQFYAERFGFPDRTPLETASYTFADSSFPPLVTTNGTGTNGIPPVVIPTNEIPTYAYGTVIYGRRNAGAGTIWGINLDGSGDHYITDGARPRLSPEGRHLAFLREGNPFAQPPINNGNIWVRDLLTGTEQRLVTQTSHIVGFDWGYGTTNLFYDDGCFLWQVGLDGVPVTLPLATECNDDAPAMNPIDGRLAWHNLGATVASQGLSVTDEALTTKQKLALGSVQPHWPAWSPDGTQLAFANYDVLPIPASAQNLYVVDGDGSDLHQITGFSQIEGFRYGAQWSPGADALVGAGSVLGVNGVWIVPLTDDRHACGAPPVRLPTTPGDPIDFVGTVFIPPRPPNLTIRRELNEAIVSWRRTAWPYVLQTADEPTRTSLWLSVPPPYTVTGSFFEHRVPDAGLQPTRFFRLRLP
jgi:hypothetical protein